MASGTQVFVSYVSLRGTEYIVTSATVVWSFLTGKWDCHSRWERQQPCQTTTHLRKDCGAQKVLFKQRSKQEKLNKDYIQYFWKNAPATLQLKDAGSQICWIGLTSINSMVFDEGIKTRDNKEDNRVIVLTCYKNEPPTYPTHF